MRNIIVVVEYDGTDYCGWQVQPNGVSIQAVLERAIALVTREPVRLTGSGRTDAGVHAMNQVANFMTQSSVPCAGLLKGINSLIPQDISIKDVREADEHFHARFSAKSKVYLYKIYNGTTRTALGNRYAWHVREALDVAAMDESAHTLIGTSDFSSFCAAGGSAENHVRTVMDAGVRSVSGGGIELAIEADGFLRHMVRNIVGTIADVGKRKLSIDDFRRIAAAKDRGQAGITAPPHGLYLKEVKYG